jgi:hypothetical protein
MSFEISYQQCLEKLLWATKQLKVEVTTDQLAPIAKLIVHTMTGPWRYFHSVEHIFAVGGSHDGIEILAALFHDLVYVQVDGSVNFNLTYYLVPLIREERGQLYIREKTDYKDNAIFEMVVEVFGFVPGQQLSPLAGQNEFLSALVAAKVLEPFFNPCLIVQIITCIEATIPFRSKSPAGLSSNEVLYERLRLINNQFHLKLTEAEIILTIKRSIRLANRDVYSFAHPKSTVFLDNTWSLLPETNHNLQKSNSYTVRDYRIALQKMSEFLSLLKPELVFRQFQGEPDNQIYQELIERTQKNLKVANIYLNSKLFAIAIIEALSLRLGSDISLSIMMGELPTSQVFTGRLEDYLPKLINYAQPTTEIEKEVINLLEVGRNDHSAYDLKTSPLTLFMVRYLGFDNIVQFIQEQTEYGSITLVQAFFQELIASEDFLAKCNPQLIEIITNGVSQLLTSRQTALFCKLPDS